MTDGESKFVQGWFQLQEEVTKTSKDHGFLDDDFDPPKALLLMHSEISEAAEVLRTGENPEDEKCPGYSKISVEIADLVIRLMVFADQMGLNIPEALILKDKYNKTRPYKHNKKF
jgi:NTP pyrophosphatase (non-canonical NTP hydrolase)